MEKKAILVLQGGGALGAYECGVYKGLVEHFKEHGVSVCAVAGTSIGAINASMIALHLKDEDMGAGALEELWSKELAVDSVPFIPWWQSGAINAAWTSLLFGHPRLYSPYFFGWNLVPPTWWAHATHFYDTAPMGRTLDRHFAELAHGYRGEEPLLVVTAVNIDKGKLVTFNSRDHSIKPFEIMASCALPPGFPAQVHKKERYWDGGLWSNTPLPQAINAIQDNPAFDPANDSYSAYIVDLFPQHGKPIENNWELWGRINQITFADKTGGEERATTLVSDYIRFVAKCEALSITDLPADSAFRALIAEESRKLGAKKRMPLTVKRIHRVALGEEEISREIDFSPRRVSELIEQGFKDARRQLS